MKSVRVVAEDRLRSFTERLFIAASVPPERARQATDVLIWASLRGVDTHGIRNLRYYYLDPIFRGEINPDAMIQVISETATTARINGGNGIGLNTAFVGMETAVRKAESSGVGIVTVRNSHHLGPAGYYAAMALDRDMIGVCLTGHFFAKGRELGVAPFNTMLRMLSTNPLSFAAPCHDHPPFLLDMSTSIATVNRVQKLGQAGLDIPEGWACDDQGKPARSAESAKSFLPLGGTPLLGGHKGLGLSMMVSILCGVLSGEWERDVTSEGQAPFRQPTMGHFMLAVKIDHLMPTDVFKEGLDAWIAALEGAPRIDPEEPILYPGAREAAVAEFRRQQGIPLTPTEWTDLEILADRYRISLPG